MRTWHIFGNSPSILEEDVEALRTPYVIGVNRILQHFEPSYLMIVDRGVWEQEVSRIRKFKGKILTWTRLLTRLKQDKLWFGHAVDTFDLTERRWHIVKFAGEFIRCGNTGLYAMEYAARQIYPNRGKILLHGMDFKVPRKGPTHFFGDGYTKKYGCSRAMWHQQLRSLEKSAKFLAKAGILVQNASSWNGPLDRFLPRIRP